MAWVSVYLSYSIFQSSFGLTGKVVVLKYWVTDIIASYLVTRESEIYGRKMELLKVLMRIKRGGENWIFSSRDAYIQKTSAGLVMRVLGT